MSKPQSLESARVMDDAALANMTWLIAEYECEAAAFKAAARKEKCASMERYRLLRQSYERQKFANTLRRGLPPSLTAAAFQDG